MVEQIGNQSAQAASLKKDTETKPQDQSEFNFFGDDGFTFLDFVDMINPLQHIPVVSTAYREMTGDEIDPGARLVGGGVFGGPLGLLASVANVALEANTGKDVGEHVMAMFEGEEVAEQPTYAKQESFTDPNKIQLASVQGGSHLPAGEADAFAAGQASLRMADIHDFMQPDLYPSTNRTSAPEIPTIVVPQPSAGARGSAGTWTPPTRQDVVPDELINHAAKQPPKPQDVANLVQNNTAFGTSAAVQQQAGFTAKSAHSDSLDALRAFARDVKMQQAQMQAAQAPQHPQKPRRVEQADTIGHMTVQRHIVQQAPARTAQEVSPPTTSTRQLSQTDSNWFAQMMNQNMDRYKGPQDAGRS